jgi:hypothetical protein
MRTIIFVLTLAISTTVASAEPPDFSGRWTIDLRTPDERSDPDNCGIAEFDLAQRGNRITGSHSMATVGCGRVNEDGNVNGVVVEQTAVLVVTSARTGAMVLGAATIRNGALYWEYLELIRDGEPESDSPLILNTGTLIRAVP